MNNKSRSIILATVLLITACIQLNGSKLPPIKTFDKITSTTAGIAAGAITFLYLNDPALSILASGTVGFSLMTLAQNRIDLIKVTAPLLVPPLLMKYLPSEVSWLLFIAALCKKNKVKEPSDLCLTQCQTYKTNKEAAARQS